MLAAQRQSLILSQIAELGAARITELAETLDVSEMTVRRDIDLLAEQGLLDKVHGGAVGISEQSKPSEPPFKATSLREQIAKDSIAAKAAELIKPGDAIALMGGSTVFAMAKYVAKIPDISVITNSLPVSDYLHQHESLGQTVLLTGGSRTPTDSLVGDLTIQAFENVNPSFVFMGAYGMDPDAGFSSPNIAESETNRAIRERAQQVVVLADHTKWQQRSFSTFAQLSEVDVLITDDLIDSKSVKLLREKINTVYLAKNGK